MQLSDNFTLQELSRSATASRLGINNVPTDRGTINALRQLAQRVLQPIRDAFGPYSPSSAYRNPTLNARVGGEPDSQHLQGEAADIHIANVPDVTLARWCARNLPVYDQIILEPSWVHVSLDAQGRNRRETLRATQTARGMVYRPISLA